MLEKMMDCPECEGYGSERGIVDIEDYFPCALCHGDGKVPLGTQTWMERLLLSKDTGGSKDGK